MNLFIQYSLFLYLIINFGTTFVLPSYRVWKKTGIFPVTFSNEDTAHDYIGRVFKMLLGLLLVTGALYTFYPQGLRFLLPVWYLEIPAVRMSGIVLLFVTLIWIIIAQYQMANSWRIGIDEKNKTDLVSTGLFAVSRNPIFLGMISTLFGLFLTIPNAITFMVLVAGYIVVQVQVRLEEAFLQKMHGAAYQKYCSETKRWL